MNDSNNIECCPEFNPNDWQDKILDWDNKLFIKENVFTLFYIPINFGGTMKKLDKLATKSNAKVLDNICLSDHTSKWKMEVLLAVDKKIENAQNIELSGKYYCRIYEGNFKETGNWCKDYEAIKAAKGYKANKLFMWYTTCPKCAKKYGKNYVGIISKID